MILGRLNFILCQQEHDDPDSQKEYGEGTG